MCGGGLRVSVCVMTSPSHVCVYVCVCHNLTITDIRKSLATEELKSQYSSFVRNPDSDTYSGREMLLLAAWGQRNVSAHARPALDDTVVYI